MFQTKILADDAILGISFDDERDISQPLGESMQEVKCITCHDVQVLIVSRDSGRSEEKVLVFLLPKC